MLQKKTMSRIGTYFVATALIMMLIVVICLIRKPAAGKQDNPKTVNLEKESFFRKDVDTADSLYRLVEALAGEQSQTSRLPEAEAEFSRQLAYLKKQYGGSTAPAVLASKLIRNYEARLFLLKQRGQKQHVSREEQARLQTLVSQLEAENQDLKTQNQMIQQALLNLP